MLHTWLSLAWRNQQLFVMSIHLFQWEYRKYIHQEGTCIVRRIYIRFPP